MEEMISLQLSLKKWLICVANFHNDLVLLTYKLSDCYLEYFYISFFNGTALSLWHSLMFSSGSSFTLYSKRNKKCIFNSFAYPSKSTCLWELGLWERKFCFLIWHFRGWNLIYTYQEFSLAVTCSHFRFPKPGKLRITIDKWAKIWSGRPFPLGIITLKFPTSFTLHIFS